MRDASDRGFGCVLVEDASGADAQEYHEAACVVLQRLYGHVMQTDDVLARLEGARRAARLKPPSAGSAPPGGQAARRCGRSRPRAR